MRLTNEVVEIATKSNMLVLGCASVYVVVRDLLLNSQLKYRVAIEVCMFEYKKVKTRSGIVFYFSLS